MSKQLKAADDILCMFVEQIEGPYRDAVFDCSVNMAPLVLNVEKDEYSSLLFEWSGTEKLDLRNIVLSSDVMKTGQFEIMSNTPEFTVDDVACSGDVLKATPPDSPHDFFARITFPNKTIDSISIERFANFQPLAKELRLTLAKTSGEAICVYDKSEREKALLEPIKNHAVCKGAPVVTKLILPILMHCVNLRLDSTRTAFKRVRKRFGMDFFNNFGILLNKKMLNQRHLEFGQHGVSHSFRYWPDTEKRALVESYSTLVKAYDEKNFQSICCFGFLLGMVRDNGFIPHDDDIDLLVFNHDPKVTDLQLMTNLCGIAIQAGFEVIKIAFEQRFARLKSKDNKDLDVFVCNVLDNKCFVYPSSKPHTDESTIFPIGQRQVFGHSLPFPHKPEALLEDIYGSDWNIPKPYFLHQW